jgi:hypothetical protein
MVAEGVPVGNTVKTPLPEASTMSKTAKLADTAVALDGTPHGGPVNATFLGTPERIGPPARRVSRIRQGAIATNGSGPLKSVWTERGRPFGGAGRVAAVSGDCAAKVAAPNKTARTQDIGARHVFMDFLL